MAITVGTDTYLSVADADTYWSNRNNSTWSAASTAEKEAALREATQFIDGAYEFIGQIVTSSQLLAFPRSGLEIRSGNFKYGFINNVTIPFMVENATAELALEALSGRLLQSQERGGRVKREKIGQVEIEYADFAPSNKTYDFVTIILRPLLVSSGRSSTKLMRS